MRSRAIGNSFDFVGGCRVRRFRLLLLPGDLSLVSVELDGVSARRGISQDSDIRCRV
jgi:hypothetical protein